MLQSGLPETVNDSEELVRFLTSSRQFSKNNAIVKQSAFLPNRDAQTSVFRHGSEPSDTLWQLGEKHVANERTLHGVALFRAIDVRHANLEVKPQEPPPRHADIINWPQNSDPALEKAMRKEVAMMVAKKAKLLLANN